ncbi:MAG: 2-amino-4-hydroxy-6-hydroxymethyldihydropteridine diphosphokinase [Caldilineales bacterium]
MNTAYISLGSNIRKEYNLPAAVRLLAAHGDLLAVSAIYETAPVGNPRDPSFFNAALSLRTPLLPPQLKSEVLAQIEAQLGRQRTADPNAARTVDLDIALFNEQTWAWDKYRIPDPDILRFAHVAVPLAEIAPDYRLPATGEILAAVAARLSAALPAPLLRRADLNLWPTHE